MPKSRRTSEKFQGHHFQGNKRLALQVTEINVLPGAQQVSCPPSPFPGGLPTNIQRCRPVKKSRQAFDHCHDC
eukprot:1144935-Pelagomonas_calceolata.AAC.3